jgi:hypothetical protein
VTRVTCTIVAFASGAFTSTPAVRAVREGEGQWSYSLPKASATHAPGAPLDRRLFSAEDADSSRTFSDLGEPSPNRVDL